MKIIFVLFVVVGVGWAALYYAGGYDPLDPTEQGRTAKAAIKPGMSWTQVFDIAREPRKYRIMNMKKRRVGGQDIEYLEPSPLVKFSKDRLLQRLAENSLPHGFVITYNYSNREAFTVTFDGTGNVKSIADASTMADLLQTKD